MTSWADERDGIKAASFKQSPAIVGQKPLNGGRSRFAGSNMKKTVHDLEILVRAHEFFAEFKE